MGPRWYPKLEEACGMMEFPKRTKLRSTLTVCFCQICPDEMGSGPRFCHCVRLPLACDTCDSTL